MISSNNRLQLYQPYMVTIVGLKLSVMLISFKEPRLSGGHDGIDGA